MTTRHIAPGSVAATIPRRALRLRAAARIVAALACLTSGCGPTPPAVSLDDLASSPTDAAALPDLAVTPDLAMAASTLCDDPRADAYALPLEKPTSGGQLRVALTATAPSPPARGMNDWTVRVTRADGSPAADVGLSARAAMPDHGHGTAPPTITPGAAPGEHRLGAMNLFMVGVWVVEVSATLPGGGVEKAAFTFCLSR